MSRERFSPFYRKYQEHGAASGSYHKSQGPKPGKDLLFFLLGKRVTLAPPWLSSGPNREGFYVNFISSWWLFFHLFVFFLQVILLILFLHLHHLFFLLLLLLLPPSPSHSWAAVRWLASAAGMDDKGSVGKISLSSDSVSTLNSEDFVLVSRLGDDHTPPSSSTNNGSDDEKPGLKVSAALPGPRGSAPETAPATRRWPNKRTSKLGLRCRQLLSKMWNNIC